MQIEHFKPLISPLHKLPVLSRKLPHCSRPLRYSRKAEHLILEFAPFCPCANFLSVNTMGKRKQSVVIVEKKRKRKASNVSGKGAYKIPGLKSVQKSWARVVPKSTRRLLRKRGTSLLNSGLARGLDAASLVVGGGSYRTENRESVSKNSLFGGRHSFGANDMPSFSRHKNGIKVVRTEYVADVVAVGGTPSSFDVTSYLINPSQPGTFPWLSQIACNFREWQMLGCIFEYRSTSGAYTSASTSLGQVIMAEQMNVNDPAFINKYEMENYFGSISSAPDHSIMCGIECDPKLLQQSGRFFTGNVVDYQHCLGTFNIATNAIPVADTIVGELWVSYEIEFFDPILAEASNVSCGNYLHVNIPTATVSGSNPFGTSAVTNSWGLLNGISTASSLWIQIISGANRETFCLGPPGPGQTVSQLPPGSMWMMIYQLTYSGNESQSPITFAALNNCQLIDATNDYSNQYNGNGGSTTVMTTICAFQVLNLSGGGVVELTASGGTAVSGGQLDFWVFPMPSNGY